MEELLDELVSRRLAYLDSLKASILFRGSKQPNHMPEGCDRILLDCRRAATRRLGERAPCIIRADRVKTLLAADSGAALATIKSRYGAHHRSRPIADTAPAGVA